MNKKTVSIKECLKHGSEHYQTTIFYLEGNAFSQKASLYTAHSSIFANGAIPEISINSYEALDRTWERTLFTHTMHNASAAYMNKENNNTVVAAERIRMPFIIAQNEKSETGTLYPAGSYILVSEQLSQNPDTSELFYNLSAMTEEEFHKAYPYRSLEIFELVQKRFPSTHTATIDRTEDYAQQLQTIFSGYFENGNAVKGHIHDIKDEIGRKVTLEYLERLKQAYMSGATYSEYQNIYKDIANAVAPNCELLTTTDVFNHAAFMGAMKVARDIFIKDEQKLRATIGDRKADTLAQDWANAAISTKAYYEFGSVPFVYGLVKDAEFPRPCFNVNDAIDIALRYGNRGFVESFRDFAGQNTSLLKSLRTALKPDFHKTFNQRFTAAKNDKDMTKRLNKVKTSLKKQYGL